MAKKAAKYTDTLGSRLLQALTEEGRYIFTAEEARLAGQKLDIGYTHLRGILSKLENSGWIFRLKGGLYASTGGLPGSTHVHSFAIATHLISPSAISHISALNFHGLTEQIPLIVTASTPKSFVTPSMREPDEKKKPHAWVIEGVSYEFIKIKPERFFGIEEIWVDTLFRVPITDKERTMLDGFAYPKRFGSMGEVLGIMEESSHLLDIDKLIRYTLKYNKGSVIKRIGWALDKLGVASEKLDLLKAYPSKGYHLLDPSKPKTGKYDKTWMIQDNLMIRK